MKQNLELVLEEVARVLHQVLKNLLREVKVSLITPTGCHKVCHDRRPVVQGLQSARALPIRGPETLLDLVPLLRQGQEIPPVQRRLLREIPETPAERLETPPDQAPPVFSPEEETQRQQVPIQTRTERTDLMQTIGNLSTSDVLQFWKL